MRSTQRSDCAPISARLGLGFGFGLGLGFGSGLTLSLTLTLTFREGVACAVGARRGEAPVWRPATLEEAGRDPGLRAAMDAAGLSDWS